MDNRVNYLSDKLVHLRGGLKSVDEVMTPPEPAEKRTAETPNRPNEAIQRRLHETEQLYNDLVQRIVRRKAQLQALAGELKAQEEKVAELTRKLDDQGNALPQIAPDEAVLTSASAVGEAYRAVDARRLEYFALDAECERLLQTGLASGANLEPETKKADDFKILWKRGWALALSLGVVIALALLVAALILFAAWR